ncbi:MAG: hypothetical protein ACE5G5_00160 [Candidatus Methylomirabilales bacterium]
MVKRLLILLVTVGLVAGSFGLTGAAEHDFWERGTEKNIIWRWPAFVLYPAGALTDFIVAKPVTYFFCLAPGLTGCTPKEQRYLGMGPDIGDWALDEAVEEDRNR